VSDRDTRVSELLAGSKRRVTLYVIGLTCVSLNKMYPSLPEMRFMYSVLLTIDSREGCTVNMWAYSEASYALSCCALESWVSRVCRKVSLDAIDDNTKM